MKAAALALWLGGYAHAPVDGGPGWAADAALRSGAKWQATLRTAGHVKSRAQRDIAGYREVSARSSNLVRVGFDRLVPFQKLRIGRDSRALAGFGLGLGWYHTRERHAITDPSGVEDSRRNTWTHAHPSFEAGALWPIGDRAEFRLRMNWALLGRALGPDEYRVGGLSFDGGFAVRLF